MKHTYVKLDIYNTQVYCLLYTQYIYITNTFMYTHDQVTPGSDKCYEEQ